jgi:Domain of unknown function (DUF5916)/Carbohydrate family 9 binding domain-like
MLLVCFAALQLAGSASQASDPVNRTNDTRVYSGRDRALNVRAIQLDTGATIDGHLDEAAWQRAAVLTNFTSYNPVDGRKAQDSTEVRIWYAFDALYVGVRAWAPPGTIRATLAERDKITNDDWVSIAFDTFNDRRRAFTFAVNPLGVQADGMRSEQTQMPGVSRASLAAVDLTQDYVWQSKGRLLDDGYVIEVRIPFKSIRFQMGETQDWGLQVVRQTQRTGFQDTWAPTSRAQQGYQPQAGYLRGMTGMKRGLVLDVTPNSIAFANGTPRTGGWGYNSRVEAGADVRWGVTSNFTLNGTINPDFSQVETDVGQIPGDVRFALFFPELRPFFVEGSEQFDAPNRLVNTRSIVQPLGAIKLTGKIPKTDVGLLSALDDASSSVDGRTNPIFSILRLRRDIGPQSNAGLVVTDRTEGSAFNRVGGLDARIQFNRVYNTEWRLVGSMTRDKAGRRDGALWEVNTGRTGRSYGYRYGVQGISPDFATRTGFVNRTDFVRGNISQRFTRFGKRGGWWDQQQQFVQSSAVWTYDGFTGQKRPLELKLNIDNSFVLRGGWRVNIIPDVQSTGFDVRRYTSVRTLAANLRDTIAFAPSSRQNLAAVTVSASTPQWRRLGATLSSTLGRETEFFETSAVNRRDVEGSVDLRPSPKIRVGALLRYQQFDRVRDGTPFSTQFVPRVRVEYQFSRALFLRFVGQAELRRRDALRDPRTELPLLVKSSAGTTAPVGSVRSLLGRADVLLSYLPSPGTVVFVGYGSAAEASETQRPYDARRTSDGLFVKISYLFRAKGHIDASK